MNTRSKVCGETYLALKRSYGFYARAQGEAQRLFRRYAVPCLVLAFLSVFTLPYEDILAAWIFLGMGLTLGYARKFTTYMSHKRYQELVRAQEQAVSQAETLYQKGLATGDFTELDEFILGSENTGLADSFTVNFNHLFYMRGMIEIFAGFSTERKLTFLRDPGIYRGLVEPGYWTPPTGCDRYTPLALSDCEGVYYTNVWGDSECEYQSEVDRTTRLTLLACEKHGIWYLAAYCGGQYLCYPLDALETLFSEDFDPILYMASHDWEFVVRFDPECS